MSEESVRTRGNPRPKFGIWRHPAAMFIVIFAAIFLLHAPLLQLPYFWDEAGYYVPAARDILLKASLIPHSTLSNAHPPLVLAWVALWWKVFGYAPLVARSAMVIVAAFSLLGFFRLAERVANTEVAVASTLCTALYPVFFAQSSLVQVDLAAAGLTFWGLSTYLANHRRATALWFSLAVLTKETAIIAPLALAGWEIFGYLFSKSSFASVQSRLRNLWDARQRTSHRILALLFPLIPLALWYVYHFARTGYVFGNPEYFRYNVASTLNPLRFVFALALRLWQIFGYLHLWLLTLAMLLAMLLPPLQDGSIERRRISLPAQMAFLIVISAYVVVMALIGGAVLARYMLPIVPLVVIVAVSTLRRRLPYWPAAIALILAAFVLGWFLNPPYGFSPEDNLAYRDYVLLHENAERFLEARYPMAHMLTAWPASDELTRPWLGYLTRPMQVVRIEDFSLEQVLSAEDFRSHFDAALVFSTKYEPPQTLIEQWITRWQKWQEIKTQFFGYHRDLPPAAIAQVLGGKIVFAAERKGQWIAVIQMEEQEIQEARSGPAHHPTLAPSSVPLGHYPLLPLIDLAARPLLPSYVCLPIVARSMQSHLFSPKCGFGPNLFARSWLMPAIKFRGVDFIQYDSLLTEEEKLVRDTTRQFIEDNLIPIIEECNRAGRFPRELVKPMADLGFFGASLKGYGCAGMGNVEYGLMTQELERGDSGVRSFVSVQSGLCMYPIYEFGSEEQKQQWLPAMQKGEKLGCFGLTEPDFGSNPGGMRTRAKKVGNEYVINGEKMWITSGTIADVAIIWAKVEDEKDRIRGFLVETNRPGFKADDIHGKWSLRASVTSGLSLQDVRVPESNLLPKSGGLKSPLMCLNQARYGIAWGAVGAAMACYDCALQYSLLRKQWRDQPIASHQLVQDKLTWMISEITKAQLLVLQVGRLKDAGKIQPQHISMAKRNNVWMALECARLSRDILGANGVADDYPIMRHLMNLESVKTYEGTHDVHSLIIGQSVTGIDAF